MLGQASFEVIGLSSSSVAQQRFSYDTSLHDNSTEKYVISFTFTARSQNDPQVHDPRDAINQHSTQANPRLFKPRSIAITNGLPDHEPRKIEH